MPFLQISLLISILDFLLYQMQLCSYGKCSKMQVFSRDNLLTCCYDTGAQSIVQVGFLFAQLTYGIGFLFLLAYQLSASQVHIQIFSNFENIVMLFRNRHILSNQHSSPVFARMMKIIRSVFEENSHAKVSRLSIFW